MNLKRILFLVLLVAFVILAGGLIMEAFYYAILITLVLLFLGLIGGVLSYFLG